MLAGNERRAVNGQGNSIPSPYSAAMQDTVNGDRSGSLNREEAAPQIPFSLLALLGSASKDGGANASNQA